MIRLLLGLFDQEELLVCGWSASDRQSQADEQVGLPQQAAAKTRVEVHQESVSS